MDELTKEIIKGEKKESFWLGFVTCLTIVAVCLIIALMYYDFL